MLGQFKDAVKTFLHGGMLFEEMGFRYIGPVDGHDLASPAELPGTGQRGQGPGAAARLHRKGARLQAGLRRSGPLPHAARLSAATTTAKSSRSRRARTPAYTDLASDAILRGDAPRLARDRADGRHVRREQAAKNPRRVSRAVLRHGNLRGARRRVRGGNGERRACGRSSTSTARSCSAATTRSSRKSRCRICP